MPTMERRNHPRYPHCSSIEYVLNQEASTAVSEGVTIDISTRGVRLYLYQPLREGQDIIIKSDIPVNSRTATICWIRKLADSFYQAGATFAGDDSQEQP